MIVCRINGLDVSQEARVAQDEGLDPADSAFTDPKFAGSPAFTEGETFTGDAVGNREITIPLLIKPSAGQTIADRVRQINAELSKGARVEYSTDDTLTSTFFDLERGKVDINYQYWLARSGRLRCELKLWTRPYGHTGTMRTVASFTGASAGGFSFPVTGILGDVPAVGQVRMRNLVGSGVDGYMFGFGIHRSPSYQAVFPAASILVGIGLNATIVGDARAVGSQFVGFSLSPTAPWYQPALRHVVDPRLISGRSRVFGLVRSRMAATGLRLALQAMPVSEPFNSTAPLPRSHEVMATQTAASQWQLADLGEINIPIAQAGEESLPTYLLRVLARVPSHASAVATGNFHYGGLVLLPVDESAGAVVLPLGARATAVASQFMSIRSTPRARAILHETGGTPSAIEQDFTGRLRGDGPRIPPVGSPAASGPARMVVMTGQVDDWRINESSDVSVDVRERFSFLR